MGDRSRVLRILFGALIFVGLIWFSYVGVIANQATKPVITISSTGNFKHMKLMHAVHQDWDLNYVSKRRVPNGPDPIHNRSLVKWEFSLMSGEQGSLENRPAGFEDRLGAGKPQSLCRRLST
ncbi:CLAVATA3/ESR (CLE)-related protein 25 [Vitis vinifera]|uniref:CLAVATA3/ESR (CLE)-related protein 25 n=1 Tax=Vitis vinifera TaxID=29760 RepID=A0A438EFH2_VITVI|nr:CLAVATA3/ESR (CLE)-related protein 25 [Vitis vinifera]